MDLKLGIVRRNGKIVNHRSLTKVILNPLLRTIGYEIRTTYNATDDTLGWCKIGKCPPRRCFDLTYNGEYDSIEKRRRII